MKKFLLNIVFAFLSLTFMSAQDIEFNFSNDMQGWTAYDLDGNGNSFVQGKQWYKDPADNTFKESAEGVLRHNYFNLDGTYFPGYNMEDNWIISPPIDISMLNSAMDLELIWEAISPVGKAFVIFFASSSPDIESFRNKTAKDMIGYVQRTSNSAFPNFQSKTITIQKSKLPASQIIYLGIKRSTAPADFSTAFNLKQIYLAPNGGGALTLATKEVKAGKSLTKVMQNPVAGVLMLQLNPAMAAAKTQVKVYSITGQQVLNARYAKELNVSALAPGMYIAQVTDGTLTETVKFVKK